MSGEEWEPIGGGSLFDAVSVPTGESGGAPAAGGGLGGFEFDLPPFVPIRQATGNISVAAGSEAAPVEVSFVREMPFSGWIANLRVWWDQGANQLTGVQLKELGPNQPGAIHVPVNAEDDFISLNGTSETFWLWLPAPAEKPFTITVQNRDTEGHSIPFVMTIVELTDFLSESLPPEVLPPAVPFAADEAAEAGG